MRPRLLSIVLALVILPTAILSIMASRALRMQELILQRRMETAAVDVVRTVSARISGSLDAELERVRTALNDCLVREGGASDIHAAAVRLRKTKGLVGQVYLFMNPWGFVYPDEKKDEKRSDSAESLVAALRGAIASGGGGAKPLKFAANNLSYCFSPLRNSNGLYGGYEVDLNGFKDELSSVLDAAAREGLVLVADGPGFVVSAPKHLADGEVVVSDSLNGVSDDRLSALALAMQESKGNSGEGSAPLWVGRFPPPLDYIRVTAFLRVSEGTRQAARSRSRLYGWGVFLLACGIVAGTWAIVRESAKEMKLAKSRSDFVVGVTHDLRTPLASMKMLAESLYLDHVAAKEKQKEFLGSIVKECERMAQLVERVIFFVRFGENMLTYNLRESDPSWVIRSAVDAFRARFVATHAPTVQLSIQEKLPRVKMDGNAVTQVMLNLLDNAWKYSASPQGSGAERHDNCIEVSVQLVQDRRVFRLAGEYVQIAVRDHGIGMEKRELKRIFRKFYRIPVAKEENISGVGLGLALCKHIIRAHGGRIEAQSTPGQGSTFSVLLPVS